MSALRPGIPYLLARGIFGFLAAAIGLSAVVGLVLLRLHCGWLLSLVYRDSASFAANRYAVEWSDSGDRSRGFDAALRELRDATPGATLTVDGPHGRILESKQDCGVACAASQAIVVSSADVPVGGGSERVTVSIPDIISPYLFSVRGIAQLIRYMLPALLFGAGAFTLLTLYLRYTFFRHASLLLARVRAFQPGKVTEQLPRSPLGDLQEISSAFVSMAAEESFRLRQAEQEESDRKETLARLLHDLQTPLTAIEGAAERLSAVSSRESAASYEQIIRLALTGEERMAESLETLATIPPTNHELALETIDVLALCTEQLAQFSVAAEAKHLSLLPPQTAKPFVLRANGLLIARAVQNLLGNAVRYTPEGGTVSIDLAQVSEWLRITVANSGPVISSDELKRLPEAYVRGSTSDGVEGTGLGLTIVREIVQLHDGEFEFGSSAETGTRAVLSFPVAGPVQLTRFASSPVLSAVQQSFAPGASGDGSFLQLLAGVSAMALVVSTLSPGTAWLARGIAIAGGCLFCRQYGRLLPFVRARPPLHHVRYLVGMALLLDVLSLLTREGFASGIGAIAIISNTLAAVHWSITTGNVAGALLSLLGALLPFLPQPFLQEFGVGLIAGTPIVATAYLFDRRRDRSRTVPFAYRTITLAGMISAVLSAVGFFFFVPQVFRAVLDPGAQRLTRQVVDSPAATAGDLPSLAREISRLRALNPLFDFVLFARDGHYLADAAMNFAEYSHISEGALRGGRIEPGRAAGDSFSRESVLRTEPFQLGTVGAVLVVQYPSEMTVHFASRAIQYFALVYFAALLLTQLPVQLTIYGRLRRELDDRFHRMSVGLQRFARGRYNRPIDLQTADVLGELVLELNRLAARLASLEAERQRRSSELKLLCSRTAEQTRGLIVQCLALLTATDSKEIASSLGRSAASYRVEVRKMLLRSVPEPVRPAAVPAAERFPLRELWEEELAAFGAALREAGVRFSSSGGDETGWISGDPETCLDWLRWLIAEAAQWVRLAASVELTAQFSRDSSEIRLHATGDAVQSLAKRAELRQQGAPEIASSGGTVSTSRSEMGFEISLRFSDRQQGDAA